MNKNIVYISDFFLEDVCGGAELNDHELLNCLEDRGCTVLKIKSSLIDTKFLNNNKEDFFIISNFVNLSSDCKKTLMELNYIIYEHDHKYLSTRNPIIFKGFKADPSQIRNFYFYKNAKAVFCQTNFHKDIISKNMNLDNLISVGGNLWSTEILNKIRELQHTPKKNRCSILNSNTQHKNTHGTIEYCRKNKIEYDLIANSNYLEFLKLMSKNKKLIFLPKSPETLSRIVVEARMLGCSIVSNQMVGATQEDWFNLKGEELICYMLKKREEITDLIMKFVNSKNNNIKKPLISLITTFCEAEKYIKSFMENITNQSMFEECELVIVDADSNGKEKQIIKSYMIHNKNIKYIRLKDKLLPTPSLNIALKNCTAQYLSFAFVDDVKKEDCLEKLFDLIKQNPDISLVYGDVLVTNQQNEVYEENTSYKKFEHSLLPFSPENMIKCLPGPMPLWNREIHDKCGLLNEKDCNYADDWDMWLRAVNSGFKFKKLNEPVGLYYAGGRSTSHNLNQRKEEAKIFFKYSHLFGQNFHKFRPYFQQFL